MQIALYSCSINKIMHNVMICRLWPVGYRAPLQPGFS
jgi:hypothetical protein